MVPARKLPDDEAQPGRAEPATQSPPEPGGSDSPVDASVGNNPVLFEERRQSWSGPLPPPSVLVEYNDAVPNGAERILSMAEKQATHRMEMEARMSASDHSLAQTGQWIGLTVVLAVLVLAGYMAYLGATTAAVAVIGIDLAGLAAVFVYGSLSKRVIREIQIDDTDLTAE